MGPTIRQLPLQMLSAGLTPRTHVRTGVEHHARGAGISVVWPQFLALIGIGGVFFVLALTRFRKTISSMT